MRGRWLLLLAILVVPAFLLITRRTSHVSPEAEGSRGFVYSRSTTTQTRPADLAAEIQKAIASQDERGFQSLLGALVELDAPAAAALLSRIEPGPLRDEYLLRLAQFWTARDWNAALKWASALEDQSERMSALQNVCLEMAQSDPEAAIRTIENLALTDYKTSLDSMAQLWAARDISAATAWAQGRPEGEQRDGLLSRVAYVMAEQNPREAAALVVNGIAPGEIQTEAAVSIVHRWALQDWNSAREWVNAFPQGPLRDRAQHEIAGVKAYADAIK